MWRQRCEGDTERRTTSVKERRWAPSLATDLLHGAAFTQTTEVTMYTGQPFSKNDARRLLRWDFDKKLLFSLTLQRAHMYEGAGASYFKCEIRTVLLSSTWTTSDSQRSVKFVLIDRHDCDTTSARYMETRYRESFFL